MKKFFVIMSIFATLYNYATAPITIAANAVKGAVNVVTDVGSQLVDAYKPA